MSSTVPPRPRPSLALSVAVALITAACTFTAGAAALFGAADATIAALDFNNGLFEDFLGPYWGTAQRLVAGESTPAPGYLYPSTLAWVLTPFVLLEQALGTAPATSAQASHPTGSLVASWTAVGMIAASLSLLLASVFSLLRPSSLRAAAVAGAVFGLAHAPIHGAYWAQASLPAVACLAAAFALIGNGRFRTAGVLIGFATALKLHPVIGCIALVFPWRGDGASARALGIAGLSAAAFGAVIPVLLMGPADWISFHATAWEQLTAMASWVLTEQGSRGAQDIPALLRRATPIESTAFLRVAGLACAGMLIYLATKILRRQQEAVPSSAALSAPETAPGSERHDLLAVFILVAATPWAAVSPTWPHGLLWIPAAWWLVANTVTPPGARSFGRASRALTCTSVACGSLIALELSGSPGTYAYYGLPAWSAGLAAMAVGLSMVTSRR